MFESDREALLRTLTESTYGPPIGPIGSLPLLASHPPLTEAGMDPDRARQQFHDAIRVMGERTKNAGMMLEFLQGFVRAAAARPYSGAGTLPEMEKVKNAAEKVATTMQDIRSQVDLMRHAGLAECGDHADDKGPQTSAMVAAEADEPLAEGDASVDLQALHYLMEAVGNAFSEHLAVWLTANAPKLIAQSVADAFQKTSWIQRNIQKYAPLRALPWEALAAKAVRGEEGRSFPRFIADLYMREVYKAAAGAKPKVSEAAVEEGQDLGFVRRMADHAEGLSHAIEHKAGVMRSYLKTIRVFKTPESFGSIIDTAMKIADDMRIIAKTMIEDMDEAQTAVNAMLGESAPRTPRASRPTGKPLNEEDAALREIAQNRLDIGTLRTQNSDSLDFYDVGVGGLADALADAFDLGLGHEDKAAMPDKAKRLDPVLAHIAKQAGVDTLVSRGSDRLDFREMAVWTIERALEAARGAGAHARREAAAGTR